MSFWKKQAPEAGVQAVQTAPGRDWISASWRFGPSPSYAAENRLYDALRDTVPVIGAAIGKIQRLVGGFSVECPNGGEKELARFLQEVNVNAGQSGIRSFLAGYLEQLLVFGTAVGEIVPDVSGTEIAALYNARLEDLELRQGDSPLETVICCRKAGGTEPVPYPQLVLFSALNPEPGQVYGTSLLRGLPFVSGILMRIYQTIGVNWERVGNVRFAVTYKPSSDGSDRAFAKDRARQIAEEWSRAMQPGSGVSDFVAVGDVNVKVIGADNQILDSEIPVRQMLEQIVAKLGIPPFLLGLSWSTTERMSVQQTDILTSELEDYRRILEPVIRRICSLWLRLHGYEPDFQIVWENINLQDELDLATARLTNAQAAKIEQELRGKDEAF